MNEIIPHVWVGDMNDARRAPESFKILCVMWKGEDGIPARATQIQTTDYHTFSEYQGMIVAADGVRSDVALMDAAADWIDKQVNEGHEVLVHCAYGIERSPLTVVWYLMRYHAMNLKQSYDLVMEKRPQAQYRGTWMPESVRLEGVLPPRQE
jgi:hypothetical protein